MRDVLFVAAGGAIGAALRYGVGIGITARTGEGFPWHTLAHQHLGRVPHRHAACAAMDRAWTRGAHGGSSSSRAFSAGSRRSRRCRTSRSSSSAKAGVRGLANMFGSAVLGLGAAWLGSDDGAGVLGRVGPESRFDSVTEVTSTFGLRVFRFGARLG